MLIERTVLGFFPISGWNELNRIDFYDLESITDARLRKQKIIIESIELTSNSHVLLKRQVLDSDSGGYNNSCTVYDIYDPEELGLLNKSLKSAGIVRKQIRTK